ncbi:hypothetical protein [Haloplanus salinarum]|uniref:hypothetical protein n=1 Tax=Haloplanus salinarum TaxID=1912324 RepID=UPI00214CA9B6|nr:hypothetical protein [Haloplanus salinarum]
MSGCVTCGRPTPRRKCRACEIDERAAERAKHRDDDHPECPSCGGRTSGEGVKCYRCRRADGVETDGGHEVFVEAEDGGFRAETCPKCGGRLRYATPRVGAIECDDCGEHYQHLKNTSHEYLIDENGDEVASAASDLSADGGREECPRCGYLHEGESECPYCGADPADHDDGDTLRPDGGSIRGLEAGDDIERHLQNVLDASDDSEARYHARHALQYLEADQEGRR